MNTRRQFLTQIFGMAIGLSPARALALTAWKSALGSHFFRRARAAEGTLQSMESVAEQMSYVQLNLSEAPSRWLFDLILRPTRNSPFHPHPYVVDRFDGKKFSYAPDFKHELGLPLVWQQPFRDSKGQTRTAVELLPHWGSIRGVRMLREGHGFNNRRIVAPHPGGISITGLLADRSDRPLPSIGWAKRSGGDQTATLAFRSEKGSSSVNIPAGIGDPFEFLFTGVEGGPIGDSSDQLLQEIETEIRQRYGSIPDYQSKRVKAKILLEHSLASARAEYQTIVKKYLALERQIVTGKHHLVNSHPMPGFNLEQLRNPNLKQRDLLALVGPYYYNGDMVLVNQDLTKSTEGSYFKDLPYQFALVEYLLNKKMAQSMVMGMGTLENIALEAVNVKTLPLGAQYDKVKIAIERQSNGSAWFDAHNVGTVPNFLHTSIFFQVFSACLVELVDNLKANNLFDSTLIHIASEFDREPNNNCAGSDHGIHGNTTSFLTGKLKGPFVVGDIVLTSEGSDSIQKAKGTWGHGALNENIKQGFLTYENINSTVTSILGLNSLTPNKDPLMERQSGLLTPTLPPGRNVG